MQHSIGYSLQGRIFGADRNTSLDQSIKFIPLTKNRYHFLLFSYLEPWNYNTNYNSHYSFVCKPS